MALRIARRDRVVLDGSVHPEYRSVIGSYLDGRGIDIVTSEVGLGRRQARRQPMVDLIDEDGLRGRPAAGLLRHIRDLEAVAEKCREAGALLVYVVGDPVSLGLLKTPRRLGADIAVGEGQGLGLPLQFGGPGVGLMTCKQQHLRQLPAGSSGDRPRRPAGFVLTLQAREQHIRREKATSNICTSQTLLALGATIYLASMGPPASSRRRPSPKRARASPTRSSGSTATASSTTAVLQRGHRLRLLMAPRCDTSWPDVASSAATPSGVSTPAWRTAWCSAPRSARPSSRSTG